MNLRRKLIYIILGLVIPALAFFLYVSSHYTRGIILEDKIKSINAILDQNVNSALQAVHEYKSSARLTVRYPPVQGIIRARKTGIDPLDGSSLQDWKRRLQSLFYSKLETLEPVYQIRYIDAMGKELVKVERLGGHIRVVPEEELQNKSDRYYFQNTAKMQDSHQVYVSPVDLNKENGRIQIPYKPTVRFCIKVLGEDDGRFQGIVVLNVNADELFNLLNVPIFGDVFIVNQDGNLLSHPDQSKLYGAQLSHGYNYFKEQPELVKNLKKKDFMSFYDKGEKEYRVWKKLYYQDGSKDRYWVTVHRFKESQLLALFYSWHRTFLASTAVGIVIICFLAWFFADTIIGPIIEMSRAASEVKMGVEGFAISNKLKERKDEIGQLAQAVEDMSRGLAEGNMRLDRTVKEKKKKKKKRMEDLEKFNRIMIDREKRMVDLKNTINELSKELGRTPPFDVFKKET
ncbi:MAG: HAMP domain-containing protein [Candidatus Omnitrophica bacterium]|nr:HAMP domain-containing protein [Candidatus Omnitrophota bacterium]